MTQPTTLDTDRPVAVSIDADWLSVTLADGRQIRTPLAWYPRLQHAAPEQVLAYTLSPTGIHWPDLDEDLSVAGMLRGNRPRPARPPHDSHE